jgi:uncharacterized protein (DUF433 family)
MIQADAMSTKPDDQLIDTYIGPNPSKGGRDEYVVNGTLVPVWALVGHAPVVNHNLARIADDYGLPVEVVEAAFAFYRRNKAVIDNRIEANDPDFADGTRG